MSNHKLEMNPDTQEIYEPETLDKRWSNLNLDDEEIDRRREIYVRKSLKKISDEMETYLES